MKTKPIKTHRVMTFGIHKGKSIIKVPKDYLKWMVANVKHNGDKKVQRILHDAKLILAGKTPKPTTLKQVASGGPENFRAHTESSERQERPIPARVEPKQKGETWDDKICKALKLTREAIAQDATDSSRSDLEFLLNLGDSELTTDDKSRILAILFSFA